MRGTYIGNNRMLVSPQYGGLLYTIADDMSLTPPLVANGFIEMPLTKYLLKTIQPGVTFVDIGANIGYYTVMAGFLTGKTGRVIGFEANPTTYRILRDNISLNYMNDVVDVRNQAVYATEKSLTFHMSKRFVGNSSLMTHNQAYFDMFGVDEIEEVTIPGIPLHSLGKDVPFIDLVKIDIEGGEYHAFLGMEALVQEGKMGEIIFEWNTLRLAEHTESFRSLLVNWRTLYGADYFQLDNEGIATRVDIEACCKKEFIDSLIIRF